MNRRTALGLAMASPFVLSGATRSALASETGDRNKATLRRYIEEVIDGGDLSILSELVVEDFVAGSPDDRDWRYKPGRDALAARLEEDQSIRALYDTWTFSVDDMVAEGKRVMGRVVVEATKDGESMFATGFISCEFADGLITKSWSYLWPYAMY